MVFWDRLPGQAWDHSSNQAAEKTSCRGLDALRSATVRKTPCNHHFHEENVAAADVGWIFHRKDGLNKVPKKVGFMWRSWRDMINMIIELLLMDNGLWDGG